MTLTRSAYRLNMSQWILLNLYPFLSDLQCFVLPGTITESRSWTWLRRASSQPEESLFIREISVPCRSFKTIASLEDSQKLSVNRTSEPTLGELLVPGLHTRLHLFLQSVHSSLIDTMSKGDTASTSFENPSISWPNLH
jgi:hypothetical protein